MRIKCPNCGNKGSTHYDSDAFEARGTFERKPVRRCLQCGVGLFVLPPKRTKVIDADLWARMERSWARESGLEDLDANEQVTGDDVELCRKRLAQAASRYITCWPEDGRSGLDEAEDDYISALDWDLPDWVVERDHHEIGTTLHQLLAQDDAHAASDYVVSMFECGSFEELTALGRQAQASAAEEGESERDEAGVLGVELSIDFYDEDTVGVLVSSLADGDQERQLELLLFCLFAGRQIVSLGEEVSWQLDEALRVLESSPDRLLELADQGLGSLSIVPHRGFAGGKRFAGSLTCSPSFDLGQFDPKDEGEEQWVLKAREWAIAFTVAAHGFGLLGRGVNYYAPTSVLALLTDLARRRRDESDFIERLAYAATELADHGFTVTNQVPMATFIAQMCWSGKLCPECEKAVDRALERCPDCGYDFTGRADESDEKEPKRETKGGECAGLGDPLLLEDEYSKLRLEVTPLELRDSARPDDEEPVGGHRFVALRVKVRNRTRRPTDKISTIDATMRDHRGRRYEPEPIVIAPDFDEIESLDAGESASGWLVFSLPRSARPVAFRYQAGIGETGEWNLARRVDAAVETDTTNPESEATKTARAMQILQLIETGQLSSPRITSLWNELNCALEDKEQAELKSTARGSLPDAIDPESDYSRASARHAALYDAIVAEGGRELSEGTGPP